MFSFLNKKNSEANKKLKEVYEQKGFYCDEYIEAFLATKKKITSDDHMTLCEIYTEMERYEEAQKELLQIHAGSILDDMAVGQRAFCQINYYIETGDFDKAIEVYNDKVRFLDVFFKNPARSRLAGDYYFHAALLCTLMCQKDPSAEKALAEKINTYYARLREWCDIFPRNRILYEITVVRVLFVQNKEEAGEAFDNCRKTILDFDFKHEWEREYFLRKLDRTKSITHEA